MRAIVHIGTEKTGTTTIQELLRRNREALAGRGFHVVQCAGKSNHRAIPSYCMRLSRVDDFLRNRLIDDPGKRERFQQQLRQAFESEIAALCDRIHTVLLSSEHFHSLLIHADELESLRELLQPHFSEVRILVYLREQVDTALSRYSTAIKSGRTTDLDTFLQKCQANNPFYNYDTMLARWEQVFGREHIEVALFNRGDFTGGDLVTDFVSRLDESLLGAMDLSLDLENESLDRTGQAIGRAINLAFPDFEEGIGVNPLRTRLMEINYRHFRGRAQAIDGNRREAINRQFEACNEAVRKRYFPTREKLFSDGAVRSSANAAQPDLALALGEMFRHILADNNVVPQRYVDIFRDAAVRLERDHLEKAYELMNLAHRMRPDGPLIKAKREEYLSRLETASSNGNAPSKQPNSSKPG